MKSTYVDEDGDVRCPVCGARNSFTTKRTGKAKLLGAAPVGIGALAVPKRVQCNGCGTYLRREPTSQQQQAIAERRKTSPKSTTEEMAAALNAVKALRELGVPDNEIKSRRKQGISPAQQLEEINAAPSSEPERTSPHNAARTIKALLESGMTMEQIHTFRQDGVTLEELRDLRGIAGQGADSPDVDL
jgi:hypothetical protein